jgi:RNA polymerase sigma-70 factor (sigma-E family)
LGQERAFTEFVHGRSAELMRLAVLLSGNRTAAEDLLQAALYRTYRSWDRVSAAERPIAYVRRILLHEHIEAGRRRRLRTSPLAAADLVTTADPTAGVLDRDAVLRALRTVSPQQRAVLVLRHYERLTDPEIAETLGCSVGTVRAHASRGAARLRQELTSELVEHGEDSP